MTLSGFDSPGECSSTAPRASQARFQSVAFLAAEAQGRCLAVDRSTFALLALSGTPVHSLVLLIPVL